MIEGYRPLTNPARLFERVVAEVMTPPPPPDYEAWAVTHLRFGEESPFPGIYEPRRFPFWSRPFAVLSPEHASREPCIKKSAQVGGSVVAQIFIAASMDIDPCQMIYYHPTEGNAKEWARLKWRPMVRGSDRLRLVLGDQKSRDSSQTMLFYERLDGRGSLVVAGSNSGPAVSMKSARKQVQDDLAKWETLPSGDSETQADSRSKAFFFAKVLKLGTPQLEHNCRVTRKFKAGTQEHYRLPCPHCGHPQALAWENMLTSTGEGSPEDAHFTCIACGAFIEHHHLAGMLEATWRAERGLDLSRVKTDGLGWCAAAPQAREPSFHIWAAYSLLEAWSNIWAAWQAAQGVPAKEQGFYNDSLGEPFQSAGESPPYEAIRDRATASGHKLGEIPLGGLMLVAGCDCQKDRVEVHIKAFGRDGRRWTVEYRVIEGHISSEETRGALDKLLTETWPDAYGNLRPLMMLAIDGNAWTTDVLGWGRRHSYHRVIATRGAKSELAPPLLPVQSERKLDGRTKRTQKRFYNLGVSGLKATLYTALAIADPLRRAFCGYPQGLEDEFFRQLCAERREALHGRDGFITWRWVKDPNQRNEVLDTELIAEGAAIRCGWRAWTDKYADEIEARLVASGAQALQSRQPDMFDPAHAAVAEANGVRPAPAPRPPDAAPPPPKPPAAPRGRRRRIGTSYMG